MKPVRTIADILRTSLGTAGQAQEDDCLVFPESGEEIVALLHMARQMQHALPPVKPSRLFRETLHRDLLATARQKIAPPLTIQNPFDHRREILVGAAIGSTISVAAGIVAAVLIRTRTVHRSQEARSA